MSATKAPLVRVTKVTWQGIAAKEAAHEGSMTGLENAAKIILEASNLTVPFDKGTLMGTGTVDFFEDEQVASVYYDSVYAAKLHQNPAFKFKNGRRGKWLQKTFNSSKPYVLQYFGDALKVRFTKGLKKKAG